MKSLSSRLSSLFIITLLLLSLLPLSFAANTNQINHLPLLAVQEMPDGTFQGNTADLYLELREGSGRVFLDTSPLTKIDTQISTRYAKEIACGYFDLDCTHYDFIYTIRANTNIIGGPSAGAAIAALTTISMLELEYDEKVAITGTINSGGIVGPVGGVKEKIDAAASEGFTKVLIPFGAREEFLEQEDSTTEDPLTIIEGSSSEEEQSTTIEEEQSIVDDENPLLETNPYNDLIAYGVDTFGIEVVEVKDLNEVLFHLTGQELRSSDIEFVVDEQYTQIMQELETLLCQRSDILEAELDLLLQTTQEDEELATQREGAVTERKDAAATSREQGDHYSAASFCFGLNVYLGYEINLINDLSQEEISEEIINLQAELNQVASDLAKEPIETIADLQTKMVVEERLHEAQETLDSLAGSEQGEDQFYTLAYAQERIESAISWMHFFDMEGKLFFLDDDNLELVCHQKIAEAQERFQYVETYLPAIELEEIKEKITLAETQRDAESFTACLIQAAQAKAQASTVMSSLGITPENFDASIESRTLAVERIISENVEEGIFPILGYSYYEYAKTLAEQEASYSALLYLEYALELSDLDIYFPEEEGIINAAFLPDLGTFFSGFTQGFILGILLMWLFHQGVGRKARKR